MICDSEGNSIEDIVYHKETIKIGNVYLCTFNVKLATITANKITFFNNKSINSNVRGFGNLYYYKNEEGVTTFYEMSSYNNKSLWIEKDGHRVTCAELSGKLIKGFAIYIPHSEPATLSE